MEPVAGRGPVEEGDGLENGDAMADAAAFLDNAADDGRRNGIGGGDLREVGGESRDCVARVWRNGVGIGIRVIAVVVFD